MKKLIVTANPSSKGFIHKISDRLNDLSIKNWDKVEILDLYKTELQQDFLTFESLKNFELDEATKKIQEKIIWSDEIVFIFPIWWWWAPAIMKNFIDCNFTSWFAFKYVDNKPVWLLKWKTARIIATSRAPSFFYKILLHIQILWNMNIIWFCGIKQKSFTVFWNIEFPETDKEKYLKQVKSLV